MICPLKRSATKVSAQVVFTPMQSAQPYNPTNSYAPFSSNENAQTTNRTPQKKLTRLKRHEILDGVGKGGSGEGRVWEEGGSAESRGREEVLGTSREGGPGQGGPGKGRSREEGQGRGPQTHGPNWPKGASFRGLGFRFLGSLVWENHKAEKNASVSHSVRLEKSPRLKRKKRSG